MLYFRESDLARQAYDRYLISAEATLETQHVVGKELYENHINFLTLSLSRIYKAISKEGALYRNYKEKQNKYEVKLIKLAFNKLSEEEVLRLKYFKRKKYFRTAKKDAKLRRKLFLLDLKYRLIIANCDYEPEIEEESDEEMPKIGQEITQDATVQESVATPAEVPLSDDNDELTSESTIEEVEETSKESKTSNELFEEIFGKPKDFLNKEPTEENDEE